MPSVIIANAVERCLVAMYPNTAAKPRPLRPASTIRNGDQLFELKTRYRKDRAPGRHGLILDQHDPQCSQRIHR
jgi:hypothetical protein